jgi:hypothetical protein
LPEPTPEPTPAPTPPPPGTYPPYIPGQTPFPGIGNLDFLKDLDFSGLPGMGDIDMDRIIQEYQDRINAGEPEPFDSFLPEPVSTPEPVFTPPPPPPEPNGFFPGIDPRDYQDMSFEDMDFTNLGNMDFSNLPKPSSNLPKYTPPPPVAEQAPYVAPVEPEPIYTPPPRLVTYQT